MRKIVIYPVLLGSGISVIRGGADKFRCLSSECGYLAFGRRADKAVEAEMYEKDGDKIQSEAVSD